MNRRTVATLSLALTLHLIPLLIWTGSRSAHRATVDEQSVAFILVPIAPKRTNVTPAPSPPRPSMRRPVLRERHSSPVQTLEPARAVAPASAPVTPAGDTVERALHEAGRIDRALRGSTPPVPAVRPDSPYARFEAALASAFIDRSLTLTRDRYSAPDGVVIERLTQGGKAVCYMSGAVNFVPGILKDSSRPNKVNCPPADSGWVRVR
jgi:hypothetical protein